MEALRELLAALGAARRAHSEDGEVHERTVAKRRTRRESSGAWI